jgi:hypothetical protein
MENKELLPDDFLMGLFRNQSMESPSDHFTEGVMEQILREPEAVPVKKPFYLYLRSAWPYVLLGLAILLFLFTSDLPFTGYIPGKEYFSKNLLPYFQSLFSGFKSLQITMKTISIPVMVILAGGLLLTLDHFLFRKPTIRQQTSH